MISSCSLFPPGGESDLVTAKVFPVTQRKDCDMWLDGFGWKIIYWNIAICLGVFDILLLF